VEAEGAEAALRQGPAAATTQLLQIVDVGAAVAAAAVAERSTTTRLALRGRGVQPKRTRSFWARSIVAFM